ncbi:MAG: hypothetical protein MUC38_04200 [Cyclobacteriaceae bacterium]|jgi:hypothetical protein|nr:hypothetical protein [Cyclobacteriaceae bacterium]
MKNRWQKLVYEKDRVLRARQHWPMRPTVAAVVLVAAVFASARIHFLFPFDVLIIASVAVALLIAPSFRKPNLPIHATKTLL